jgi:CrcB protein
MVMTGGAIGVGGRYLAELAWPYDPAVNELPIAVIAINILGSLLAGGFLGLQLNGNPLAQVEQTNFFFVTGVLGGFTTFSAFSLQTLEMVVDGEPYLAAANVAISVVGGLLAAALGFMVAQAV